MTFYNIILHEMKIKYIYPSKPNSKNRHSSRVFSKIKINTVASYLTNMVLTQYGLYLILLTKLERLNI